MKQGLIQTLGVYTDTILICTCTAFIILCSGLYDCGANGIELTQVALTWHIGPIGKYIVAICILFFAFSSIIGNYYYGECNIAFLMVPAIPRLSSRDTGLFLAFLSCSVL